ncbi:hypothetical protein DL766_001488 [Monosporascus sp. MC13-8B]|uniref:TauD/TfdA-like domain-containing protein n=1 Tax=Monosporascus cannonballus TaxID=155416 RepID=A0ABY0H3G3_9PEZI|nr:hypothetical protein DL762_006264 [Monosporascus cannonballus]RYO99825.1 hypothetical protein DL763_001215 [Monosporascus cannonballus]RYP37494.1 hypothetical protein DL766_001488 [Monosporascus sp. MC13-8B]
MSVIEVQATTVAALPEKAAVANAEVKEVAPEPKKIRTTTGVTGMYNGTKDGKDAYIDYATGSTNVNAPLEVAITVEDMRDFEVAPTFHGNGYQLVKHKTMMHPDQFSNGRTPEGKEFIHNAYFPEVKKLVQEITGAEVVRPYIFRTRHQFEKPTDFIASRKAGASALPLAHTDRDMTTGPNGVRDVFGEEEGNRLMKKYKRFAQINVWRGIGKRVDRWPLMFIDTSDIPGGFKYEKHLAKIYSSNDPREAQRGVKAHDVVLVDDPHYKYRYASNLEVDEAFVFSSFDSDENKVVPHGGFWDNSTRDDAPARTSIECRTWCFWDPVEEEAAPAPIAA